MQNHDITKPFLVAAGDEKLAEFCRAHALPQFRAGQIAQWIFERRQCDPAKMLNLPGSLRQLLAEEFMAPGSSVIERVESPDGTVKLLIELYDRQCIEMVMIPARDGRLTLCLSTQVGCPVRCAFCASGREGLVRNLLCGEIIEEFILGCEAAGRRCDNLVFMGIGEGLLNFDELAAALELLSGRFGFAQRRITVSTSGIVPGIIRLAGLQKEYGLAISLHAPDDALRARIIPDAHRYPVAEIMAAAERYLQQAGRMVTLEYALLDGVNDAPEQARKLADLAKRHHAKINLIPFNSVGGTFRRPPKERIAEFEKIIADAGAHVTVRIEHGRGEESACGQLRLRRKKD